MNRLFLFLFALQAMVTTSAQGQVPKLVVCITVEQLRADYLAAFAPAFGERGFRRLLHEGAVYDNVRFDFPNVEQAAAFATLFTGANPVLHGIDANYRYDAAEQRQEPVLYDAGYLGNYTTEHYSPRALTASTIGDELKLASRGRSDVYAIAPDATAAILSAGTAANAAFWLDNRNGKWATTTYYTNVPWYVDRYNNGVEALSARVDTMQWAPSLPLSSYTASPYLLDDLPFRHTFSPSQPDGYLPFKTSPFVNKEINRLAMQFLNHAAFGARSCPDMLSVTYYAGAYQPLLHKPYTREIQDTYIQLDRDIEQLLNEIDKKVGLSRTLIVFTGSGYFRQAEEYPESLHLSEGRFYPKRCLALLNMYLMVTYGQDRNWVQGFFNQQPEKGIARIFLHRKAVEDAGLSLTEVQDKAAEFVRAFSGVLRVTPAHRLRDGYDNGQAPPLYYGLSARNLGDLVVELQPGRRTDTEEGDTYAAPTRLNTVPSPLIFMGNGIRPQRIRREVNATGIAPTVTYLLRCNSPNASLSQPFPELLAE